MKIKSFLTTCVLTSAVASSLLQAGAQTAQRTIKGIHVKHDGTYYFTSEEGNWSSSGCENAQYVLLNSNESIVAKEILSVALSAKHASKKVYFIGECYSDPNYYKAHSIWLQ